MSWTKLLAGTVWTWLGGHDLCRKTWNGYGIMESSARIMNVWWCMMMMAIRSRLLIKLRRAMSHPVCALADRHGGATGRSRPVIYIADVAALFAWRSKQVVSVSPTRRKGGRSAHTESNTRSELWWLWTFRDVDAKNKQPQAKWKMWTPQSRSISSFLHYSKTSQSTVAHRTCQTHHNANPSATVPLQPSKAIHRFIFLFSHPQTSPEWHRMAWLQHVHCLELWEYV